MWIAFYSIFICHKYTKFSIASIRFFKVLFGHTCIQLHWELLFSLKLQRKKQKKNLFLANGKKKIAGNLYRSLIFRTLEFAAMITVSRKWIFGCACSVILPHTETQKKTHQPWLIDAFESIISSNKSKCPVQECKQYSQKFVCLCYTISMKPFHMAIYVKHEPFSLCK